MRDPFRGGAIVDYRPLSRKAVDERFLTDMETICHFRFAHFRDRTALTTECNKAVYRRYLAARTVGWNYYRTRVDLKGDWVDRNAQGGIFVPASKTFWDVGVDGRTVTASWDANGGPGNLCSPGRFRGVLISRDQDEIVEGTFTITQSDGRTLSARMRWVVGPGSGSAGASAAALETWCSSRASRLPSRAAPASRSRRPRPLPHRRPHRRPPADDVLVHAHRRRPEHALHL